ncbi:hypothetical protein ACN8ZM_40285 (plasmid) [Burkholderia aenigmatica]|uniref:hypothetical protein n=1 Tax=Burkholderia aenigmatica TaxID=2015348 RepID=UPI003B43CAF6
MNLALGVHRGHRIGLVASTIEQPSERHQQIVAHTLRLDSSDPPIPNGDHAEAVAINTAVQSLVTKFSGQPLSITFVLNARDNRDEAPNGTVELISSLRSTLAEQIPTAQGRISFRVQPIAHGALQNLVFLPNGQVNTAIDCDAQTWAIAVVGPSSSDFLFVSKGALTARRAVGGKSTADSISNEIQSSTDQPNMLNGTLVVADPELGASIRQLMPRVILPQSPEWTVAEGFCRYALFCASRKSS